VRNVATKDEEEAEVLNARFASVFDSQTGYSQGTEPPVLEERDGEQNKPPITQEEAVNDLLCHLDTYKPMGPDGIYTRVLRELAEEVAKPLSIISQQLWLTGEVPGGWRIASVMPVYRKGQEDPGNYRPVSLTSVRGCPNPMSGRFRYDPQDEIKTQTGSNAIQPCKLYFSELGTGGWTGRQWGEREGKEKAKGRRDCGQTTRTGEERDGGKISYHHHRSSDPWLSLYAGVEIPARTELPCASVEIVGLKSLWHWKFCW